MITAIPNSFKRISTLIATIACGFTLNAAPPAPSPTGSGQASISFSVTPSIANEGEIIALEAIVYSANGAVPAPAGDVKFYRQYINEETLLLVSEHIGTSTITGDSAGSASTTFDTTGFGGESFSFKAHYVPPSPPPGAGFGSVWSSAIPVSVKASETCTGFTITADVAAGSGNPVAGQTGNWSYRITLKACDAVSNVSAQGGTSGWLSLTTSGSLVASKGTAVVRKQNNKTTVVLWTVGDLAAGEEVHLLVNMTGTVPKNSSGTVQYISGAWSAITTSTDEEPVTTKSEYTDRVSIEVQ
ncbi:MAG: hypothetical protein H0X66_09105 [Verrucomicrobia bacterium]|nr:hypothetical protein [Verrucomicrobiota bacterium]